MCFLAASPRPTSVQGACCASTIEELEPVKLQGPSTYEMLSLQALTLHHFSEAVVFSQSDG